MTTLTYPQKMQIAQDRECLKNVAKLFREIHKSAAENCLPTLEKFEFTDQNDVHHEMSIFSGYHTPMGLAMVHVTEPSLKAEQLVKSMVYVGKYSPEGYMSPSDSFRNGHSHFLSGVGFLPEKDYIFSYEDDGYNVYRKPDPSLFARMRTPSAHGAEIFDISRCENDDPRQSFVHYLDYVMERVPPKPDVKARVLLAMQDMLEDAGYSNFSAPGDNVFSVDPNASI